MNPDQLAELKNNEVLRKRLAPTMAEDTVKPQRSALRAPAMPQSLTIVHPLVVGGGAMRGAREYPKIIAERARSSMAACEREYLRLTPNEDGTATLAVCRYEALASAEEFVNEKGEENLPDSITVRLPAGNMIKVGGGEWMLPQ